MISGKIIPAIATTTATITGFIGVEIYKYVMGAALDKFRAASINLASNVFCVENLPDPNYKKVQRPNLVAMRVCEPALGKYSSLRVCELAVCTRVAWILRPTCKWSLFPRSTPAGTKL